MPNSLTRWINVTSALMLVNLLLWNVPFSPVLAQDQADESAGYYEQAVGSFHNQDYKIAFIQVKNALRLNPNDLAARILLGQVHLQIKDGASAEKELKKALEMGADKNLAKPILAKALLNQGKYKEILDKMSAAGLVNSAKSEVLTVRGKAYLARNEVKEAKKAFDRAGRLAPKKAGPQLGLVQMYMVTNQLDLAEDHSDFATSVEPQNAEAWQLKGELRRLKKDLPAALANYNEALRLKAGNIDARIGRAAALIDLKRETAALEDIDEILREIPNHSAALYLKVIIVARAKDLEGGRALIEEVSDTLSKMNPIYIENHPPATLLAGVTRFAQGNFEEARIHLKRSIGMNPQNSLARKLYAKILLQDNNSKVAATVLEPAVKLTPNDPQLLTLLGNAYLQEQRFEEATKLFETAAKLMPDRAGVLTGLAISRLARGQESQAVKQLELAMAADSNQIKAGKLLALIYLKQGDNDKAMGIINKLLAIQAENPALHNLAGIGYLNKDDHTAARSSFEQALKHDPSFFPAQTYLAKMDWADGNPGLAANRYRRILDKNPGNIQAILQLSRIAESRDRLQEAITWLEKIEVADDKIVTVQARLIDLYLKAEKPEAALSTAERLNYLEPTNFAVLIGLAKAQLALGKTDKAINTLKTTAVLSSESAPKLVKVANFQLAIKDIEGAGKSLDQALKISPDFLPAITSMATLALMDGQYDEALFRANQLQTQNPESAQGDILAGDVLMRMDRVQEAFNAYQQARKKENNAAIAGRIYQADQKLNGDQQAIKSLENWINNHPDDQAGQQALANAYLHTGKYSEAQELHEKLLDKQPKNPDLLNGLAWIYQKQGDPRALSYAEKAYDAAPDQASVLDTLGWVLVQKGQSARALKYLREAYGRASREPVVGYHISVALHRLGRNSEARQQLQKTLRLSDEFDGAKEAKALLNQLAN